MTGRLDRVHALLAAGNVPCEMKRHIGGGQVLAAGTPTSPRWDVLIWEADGELWVQHRGAIDRLPTGGTDQAVADAVKFRVVESWADQGNPQARALLSAIRTGNRESATAAGMRESAAHDNSRPTRTAGPAGSAQPVMRSVTAQLSPWGFAVRVTDRTAGDSIPTSWAWQWGLGAGAVTDFYQRCFTEFRKGVMGVARDEKS